LCETAQFHYPDLLNLYFWTGSLWFPDQFCLELLYTFELLGKQILTFIAKN
jgi:hypothetical protein